MRFDERIDGPVSRKLYCTLHGGRNVPFWSKRLSKKNIFGCAPIVDVVLALDVPLQVVPFVDADLLITCQSDENALILIPACSVSSRADYSLSTDGHGERLGRLLLVVPVQLLGLDRRRRHANDADYDLLHPGATMKTIKSTRATM